MTDPIPSLDYATPPKRPRHIWWIVLACVAALIAGAALPLLLFARRQAATIVVSSNLRSNALMSGNPSTTTTAPQQALSEEEKIQRLIQAVANAKDIRFIRNGTPFSAAAAAEHLKRKYNAAAKPISARDFIDNIASRSSMSGQSYLMRFPDGKEETSNQWLSERLREIELSTTGPTQR